MAQEQLRRAYTLMHRGEKKEAAQLVRDVLKEEKNNVNAWWMMSMLLEDEEKQAKALERVLTLKPDHKGAREKLRQIRPERQTAEIGQNMMATQEVMNLDWSKLKDDPHPDARKSKDDGKLTDDHKVATYAMLALGGFVVLVVAIVVSMAVLNVINSGPSPKEAAQAYMDAFSNMDFDQIIDLTCEQYKGEAEMAREEFTSMMNGANLEDLTIDFSGITLEVKSQNENSAIVEAGGSFSMSMPGFDMTFDISDMSEIIGDDTEIAMVKENGQWLVCESSGL